MEETLGDSGKGNRKANLEALRRCSARDSLSPGFTTGRASAVVDLGLSLICL